MSRLILILILAVAGSQLRAQLTDNRQLSADITVPARGNTAFSNRILWPEYSAFQIPPRQESILEKSLNFRLRSTGFFKNNEYSNPFVTGSSLVGIFFEPVLEYHPDAKTTIRAGAHLLKYHGRDQFDRKLPVLSLQFDATDHLSLIFGTINGTVNHGLIEPMQDFESYLINNYENGLQLLLNYPRIRSDIWLNWEQFLKPGDPFQEHFTVGANSSFMLLNTKKFQITAPFSAVFRHKGGEIDTSPLHVTTYLNMVQGIRLNRILLNSFFKSAAISQHLVEFVEINPGNQVETPYGHAFYSRISLDTKIGSLEAGYWKALDYFSPHGMPVFQSFSPKDSLFHQPNRELLVIKYQYELNLTGFLKFVFRFEPYYQFDTGKIDHSLGVYLILDDAFFITRVKRT